VAVKANAVAYAIGSVLDDSGLATQLGAAGWELATAELDLAACIERVDILPRSVVEGAT
jgi:hypothetical protein